MFQMFQKDGWEGCSSTSPCNIYEKSEKILLIIVRVVEAVLAAEKGEEGKKMPRLIVTSVYRGSLPFHF